MLKWALLLAAMLFAVSCDSSDERAGNVPVPGPLVSSRIPAAAQNASVCDLKNDPPKYNEVAVKVTGYFSRGFEVSALYDPTCKSIQPIWVQPDRPEQLEVDDISLPVVEDANFDKYDDLLASGKSVKATVVGTFFSGEKMQNRENGPIYYEGYGHMGIGSLFVVQQVLSVETTKIKQKF
ncbi:MAG: hypothetical protein ABJA02_14120 [Acidobacteriota bacterium]